MVELRWKGGTTFLEGRAYGPGRELRWKGGNSVPWKGARRGWRNGGTALPLGDNAPPFKSPGSSLPLRSSGRITSRTTNLRSEVQGKGTPTQEPPHLPRSPWRQGLPLYHRIGESSSRRRETSRLGPSAIRQSCRLLITDYRTTSESPLATDHRATGLEGSSGKSRGPVVSWWPKGLIPQGLGYSASWWPKGLILPVSQFPILCLYPLSSVVGDVFFGRAAAPIGRTNSFPGCSAWAWYTPHGHKLSFSGRPMAPWTQAPPANTEIIAHFQKFVKGVFP